MQKMIAYRNGKYLFLTKDLKKNTQVKKNNNQQTIGHPAIRLKINFKFQLLSTTSLKHSSI
jgi:hypothetical protein